MKAASNVFLATALVAISKAENRRRCPNNYQFYWGALVPGGCNNYNREYVDPRNPLMTNNDLDINDERIGWPHHDKSAPKICALFDPQEDCGSREVTFDGRGLEM